MRKSETIGQAVAGSARAPGLTTTETKGLLKISHATLYRLLASGKLTARKCGSRTIIDAASVEQYWQNLPPATFRAPAKQAA